MEVKAIYSVSPREDILSVLKENFISMYSKEPIVPLMNGRYTFKYGEETIEFKVFDLCELSCNPARAYRQGFSILTVCKGFHHLTDAANPSCVVLTEDENGNECAVSMEDVNDYIRECYRIKREAEEQMYNAAKNIKLTF